MTCQCCWCHAPLEAIGGTWWCPTPACRARQAESAVYVTEEKVGRYLYVPTPKQAEFDQRPERYVLFGGAAGPGKSYAARWALYRRCLRLPNYECLLLRRTFPELEKTHLRAMAREADLIGAAFHETKRTMTFPNGSLIEGGHMENAEDVQKYLSTEYDCIIADEGSTFEPGPLLELSTRARTSKPHVLADGGAKFYVVSNPGGPAALLLLDLFLDHQPNLDDFPALADVYRAEDWAYVPAQLEDNPYLDPAYVRGLAVLSKWRYEQLRHGNWRVFAGQFFSRWDERIHVATVEVRGGLWFESMDWGYNQPGCWLWWVVLPDHHLAIVDEWKFQALDVKDVVAGVKARRKALGVGKPAYTVGDPAIWIKTGLTYARGLIGESIGETFSRHGISILKADHERVNGWMRCQALLGTDVAGRPWLTVDPRCRYLLRTIPAAQSEATDADDVDTTGDDHALDAWRYGAMSRPHPEHPRHASRPNPNTIGAWLTEARPRRGRLSYAEHTGR